MIVVHGIDLVFDGMTASSLPSMITVGIVELGEVGAKPVIKMHTLLDLLIDSAMIHLTGL